MRFECLRIQILRRKNCTCSPARSSPPGTCPPRTPCTRCCCPERTGPCHRSVQLTLGCDPILVLVTDRRRKSARTFCVYKTSSCGAKIARVARRARRRLELALLAHLARGAAVQSVLALAAGRQLTLGCVFCDPGTVRRSMQRKHFLCLQMLSLQHKNCTCSSARCRRLELALLAHLARGAAVQSVLALATGLAANAGMR